MIKSTIFLSWTLPLFSKYYENFILFCWITILFSDVLSSVFPLFIQSFSCMTLLLASTLISALSINEWCSIEIPLCSNPSFLSQYLSSPITFCYHPWQNIEHPWEESTCESCALWNHRHSWHINTSFQFDNILSECCYARYTWQMIDEFAWDWKCWQITKVFPFCGQVNWSVAEDKRWNLHSLFYDFMVCDKFCPDLEIYLEWICFSGDNYVTFDCDGGPNSICWLYLSTNLNSSCVFQ